MLMLFSGNNLKVNFTSGGKKLQTFESAFFSSFMMYMQQRENLFGLMCARFRTVNVQKKLRNHGKTLAETVTLITRF